MKKLNRKGFTLVELLAVIIILAIVVGISIPAITNVINDAKNNSLGVAADAAEKYIGDQYSLMAVDASMTDAAFKKLVTTYGAQTITLNAASTTIEEAELKKQQNLIKSMGFQLEDVSQVQIKIKADDTVCVTVKKIPKTSQYYTTEYWNGTSPRKDADGKVIAKNTSKSC